MNHNEIEACVIRAKRGSQEDLLKLLEQYNPFIFKTARTFNIRNLDLFDLVQLGYVTVINAAIKYKIGSHTFSSYAMNAIKNEFKYAARSHSKSNNNALSINENEFIDFVEAPDNFEEELINFEEVQEVRKAVAMLSEEEKEFVIMVYYNKIPVTTYALKKNINYNKAISRRDNILKKLSTYIKVKE